MRSMQCNVEFGYELNIRSGTKENHGKPWSSWLKNQGCHSLTTWASPYLTGNTLRLHYEAQSVFFLGKQSLFIAKTVQNTHIQSEPKVHYLVHNNPSLISILRQINPLHTTPSYFRSILILSTYVLVFLAVHFLLSFLLISYPNYFSPTFALHVLPISSYTIFSVFRQGGRGYIIA
jgi:hypothetical protein